MKIDGGCHCGNITFVAEIDPEKVTICHCTDCQNLSGSAYRVFVPVAKDALKLSGGKPKTYIKTAESGSRRMQGFCPECGTSIFSGAAEDPQFFTVRIGTVRQRAGLPPKTQQWYRSALGWAMDLRAVRQVAKQQAH